MNLGQMNLFDCERQRAYFERTNKRLKTKILRDEKREKIVEIWRIQVCMEFTISKENRIFM